jgi:hypothetical protein
MKGLARGFDVVDLLGQALPEGLHVALSIDLVVAFLDRLHGCGLPIQCSCPASLID